MKKRFVILFKQNKLERGQEYVKKNYTLHEVNIKNRFSFENWLFVCPLQLKKEQNFFPNNYAGIIQMKKISQKCLASKTVKVNFNPQGHDVKKFCDMIGIKA